MSRVMSDHARFHELCHEHWRRICRREPTSFCVHALAWMGETPARYHHRICSQLETVARDDVPRLTVSTPPGAAKMAYVSGLFAAWYFRGRPDAISSQRVTRVETGGDEQRLRRLHLGQEYHILSRTKLSRPLEHRIGSVASMKPGSGTHLVALK